MTEKYLVLNELSKVFQRKTGDIVQGLQDINLTVNKGEIIAIIGTNGAGKSTLFNALTGHIKLDSGLIHLNSKDITDIPQVERASIVARVFQDPNMGTAPRMTVFENMMLAKKRGQKRGLSFSLNQENKDKIGQYVAQFNLDLEKRLDLPIEHLSGGQRQTISLVMATLQQPELLLLDEHTSALDPRTAKQVMEMTHKMVKDNHLTTLMITHHMQDALKYADRIVALHQGKIAKIYSNEEKESLQIGDLHELLEKMVEIDANA
ncbi:ABC transporter ATP-binding protein [Aerococcaceae bacterium WGS1372]